jgi:hypothetical protein
MDGWVIAINFGDLIPLAASAEAVNHSVQNRPRRGLACASGFRRIELVEQPLYAFPEVVWQHIEIAIKLGLIAPDHPTSSRKCPSLL